MKKIVKIFFSFLEFFALLSHMLLQIFTCYFSTVQPILGFCQRLRVFYWYVISLLRLCARTQQFRRFLLFAQISCFQSIKNLHTFGIQFAYDYLRLSGIFVRLLIIVSADFQPAIYNKYYLWLNKRRKQRTCVVLLAIFNGMYVCFVISYASLLLIFVLIGLTVNLFDVKIFLAIFAINKNINRWIYFILSCLVVKNFINEIKKMNEKNINFKIKSFKFHLSFSFLKIYAINVYKHLFLLKFFEKYFCK